MLPSRLTFIRLWTLTFRIMPRWPENHPANTSRLPFHNRRTLGVQYMQRASSPVSATASSSTGRSSLLVPRYDNGCGALAITGNVMQARAEREPRLRPYDLMLPPLRALWQDAVELLDNIEGSAIAETNVDRPTFGRVQLTRNSSQQVSQRPFNCFLFRRHPPGR